MDDYPELEDLVKQQAWEQHQWNQRHSWLYTAKTLLRWFAYWSAIVLWADIFDLWRF